MNILSRLINGYNTIKSDLTTLKARVDALYLGTPEAVLPEVPTHVAGVQTPVLAYENGEVVWKLLHKSGLEELEATMDKTVNLQGQIDDIGQGNQLNPWQLVPELEDTYDTETHIALLTQTKAPSGNNDPDSFDNSWVILEKVQASVCNEGAASTVTIYKESQD